MRAYYFFMKFVRGFWVGFLAAGSILALVTAVGLVVYDYFLGL